MPLAVGKETLKSDLLAMYSDVSAFKDVGTFAKRKSQAIADFVITGIPMTILTNFPGGVAGAMTTGPVLATGIGGFDKPVPGMGLASAKDILKADLIDLWSHGGANVSAAVYAEKMATAIFKYYSEAIIQTLDTSNSPLPAPPPAGPVTGPMIGIGGTLSPVPGTGYSSAKPLLEAELKRIWSQIANDNPRSISLFAKDLSDAIHNFCIEGKVDTIGVIIAPAAVAPPPAPPAGGYFPGTGTATGVVS
jgi:hypothetical protein